MPLLALLLGLALLSGPPAAWPSTPVAVARADADDAPDPPARDPLVAVAGYAAKVTASAIFVGGRDLASVQEGELKPVRAIERAALALVRLEVDRSAGTVTASLPGGASATAVHRPGLGCALAIGVGPEDLRGAALPAEIAPTWPLEPVPSDLPLHRDRLEAALDRAMADGRRSDFQATRAIVVLVDGRLAAERFADGFDAASRHAGWSMAKTITGALVGIRAAEGALDLEAPAPVAEWRGDGDPRAAITTLDLLRMSSGLEFDEDYADLTSDATWMLFGSADVGAAERASGLAAPPGTRWAYSSGTSNLIQSLLRATFEDDAAYHAWPRDVLFGPAGLSSAVLEADASGTFVGSSFAWMTARDWARFGQLLLDDGVVVRPGEESPTRVLPEGWVELMSRPAPAARARQFGGHLWLNRGPAGSPLLRTFPTLPTDLVYLSGYEGQYVVAVPSAGVVVARLGISKGSARSGVEQLVRSVLDALGRG